MGRTSFRDKIIKSGMQTVQQRGFGTVGIREVTAAAGVPQGSFTNHFANKEEFGVAVLDHYFDQLQTVMAGTLGNQSLRPIERLRAYFERITDFLVLAGFRFGCLAGNLGLEASEHSKMIRQRLSEVFAEWTQPFAEVIRLAQLAGEARPDLDPDETGAALLEAGTVQCCA